MTANAPTKTPPATTKPGTWVIEDDGLDDLSNSVLDLIPQRRFDEALAVCKRLLEEFPDVCDGFDRSGMVHEAMGNHALAAEFYRRGFAFASDPVRSDGYDEEAIDDYRQRAEEQERLAGLR